MEVGSQALHHLSLPSWSIYVSISEEVGLPYWRKGKTKKGQRGVGVRRDDLWWSVCWCSSLDKSGKQDSREGLNENGEEV